MFVTQISILDSVNRQREGVFMTLYIVTDIKFREAVVAANTKDEAITIAKHQYLEDLVLTEKELAEHKLTAMTMDEYGKLYNTKFLGWHRMSAEDYYDEMQDLAFFINDDVNENDKPYYIVDANINIDAAYVMASSVDDAVETVRMHTLAGIKDGNQLLESADLDAMEAQYTIIKKEPYFVGWLYCPRNGDFLEKRRKEIHKRFNELHE